jgi:hypothetical protein
MNNNGLIFYFSPLSTPFRPIHPYEAREIIEARRLAILRRHMAKRILIARTSSEAWGSGILPTNSQVFPAGYSTTRPLN